MGAGAMYEDHSGESVAEEFQFKLKCAYGPHVNSLDSLIMQCQTSYVVYF